MDKMIDAVAIGGGRRDALMRQYRCPQCHLWKFARRSVSATKVEWLCTNCRYTILEYAKTLAAHTPLSEVLASRYTD